MTTNTCNVGEAIQKAATGPRFATFKQPNGHIDTSEQFPSLNPPCIPTDIMHINILAISAVLSALTAANATAIVPTTLQKRYTPQGPNAQCISVCKDYFDDCGNTYGPGCFASCPGYPEPTFTTPVCNEAVITTTAPPQQRYTPPPGESASCPYICKDYFDDCGNTYGPGCFSSCPGYPEPTYTTPACNAAEPTA